MTKRTRRKKMKKFLSCAKLILAIGALLSILSLLLPVVKIDSFLGEDLTVNGFKIIFGWNNQGELITIKYSNFTFAGLLAIILPIAGTFFALLKTKICGIFSAACFVGAIIVCVIMPNILSASATDALKILLGATQVRLEIGAIIAIVINGLMAILSLIKTFYN